VRAGEQYRIERPTISGVMADLRLPRSDIGPGDPVPRFTLPTTDGGQVSSDDLARDGRPTLLVFGSLTCPVTESGAGGLRALHARYGDQVRFVMVNVREAHPGRSVRQPTSIEEKARSAARLKAHHQLPFEVAVDDIDGTVHRAFGPRPNSAFIISADGTVVFRAHWANVTGVLDEALGEVAAGRPPKRATSGKTFASMVKMTGHADVAFEMAGPGALADTWKVAPPFGAMIGLSRMFGFVPRDKRGGPVMVLMMLLMTAMLAAGGALVSL
jgi:thiol-disulfide isomerase/thioredoxin